MKLKTHSEIVTSFEKEFSQMLSFIEGQTGVSERERIESWLLAMLKEQDEAMQNIKRRCVICNNTAFVTIDTR